MPTIVQKALQAQRSAIKTLDGRTVLLSRGEDSVTVTGATIGETRSEDYLEDQIITTVRVRDWLIDVDQYDFGSGAVNPAAGDLITYDGDRWEVLPLSAEPEYRRSDRDGTTWRVHCKQVVAS